MATLQKQGVPIPSHLGSNNAPESRPTGSTSANRQSASRSATRQSSKSVSNRQSRNTTRSQSSSGGIPTPVSAGSDTVSGVGLLEAEFILAILLLVLLMFTSTADTLAAKVMSTMKRGTLICAVFFVLALVAGIGPSASKFAKAFGALVIVAILVTSDMTTVLTDLDNVIKNDWIPTTETGTDTAASADAGTTAVSSDAESKITAAIKAAGSPNTVPGPPGLATAAKSALKGTLNGIIPGSGDAVAAILGFI